MTTLLKNKNGVWFCLNCMMRQPEPLQSNCYFCGNMFSNWEAIQVKQYEEEFQNENYLHGRNRNPDCVLP